MKKLAAVLALAFVVCPLFAQGVSEIAGGFASGAASGASLGSVFPGLGTLGGAMIGGLIGLFKGASDTRKERENEYFNMQQSYDALKSSYENLELGIQQQEANLSTYDQALIRWQDQYESNRRSLELQGQSQFQSLMNNWMDTENAIDTMGQSGGTADLLVGSQKRQVASFVGSDLRLDSNGGMFGDALREFGKDSSAEFQSYIEQREIERQALGMNRETLAGMGTELASQKDMLNKAIGKYNFWNSGNRKQKVV